MCYDVNFIFLEKKSSKRSEKVLYESFYNDNTPIGDHEFVGNHYDLAECFIVFVNILMKVTPHEVHFDDNEMIQFYEFIHLMTCVSTRSIYILF